MKKTIKIITVSIMLLFALVFTILIVERTIDTYKYIKGAIQLNVTEEYIRSIFLTRLGITLAQIGVLMLVLFNAFFILFDFYFQEPMFKFQAKIKANYEANRERIKANREAKREQAKQKKYSKLKSKIEKMESDK